MKKIKVSLQKHIKLQQFNKNKQYLNKALIIKMNKLNKIIQLQNKITQFPQHLMFRYQFFLSKEICL